LHRRVGDEVSWKREYLLEIIPEDWQIIFPEWIRVYDHLPDNAVPNTIYISADLAISEKASADCTAIVVGYAYGYGNDLKVYVLDRPVNKRMGFPETLETIQKLYDEHRKICSNIKLLIEDIAYQRAAIQELIQRGYPAKGVQPTTDKRSRLMTVSGYFKMGTIILPKHGADDLHLQITGFGRDRFDDLVDATSQMLISLVFERPTMPVIGMLNMDTGKVEIMGRTTNRFSQPIESFTVEASDFIGGSQYWGPESDPSDNPKS
jgi:predicted phage terminase large subunit-like protein